LPTTHLHALFGSLIFLYFSNFSKRKGKERKGNLLFFFFQVAVGSLSLPTAPSFFLFVNFYNNYLFFFFFLSFFFFWNANPTLLFLSFSLFFPLFFFLFCPFLPNIWLFSEIIWLFSEFITSHFFFFLFLLLFSLSFSLFNSLLFFFFSFFKVAVGSLSLPPTPSSFLFLSFSLYSFILLFFPVL